MEIHGEGPDVKIDLDTECILVVIALIVMVGTVIIMTIIFG